MTTNRWQSGPRAAARLSVHTGRVWSLETVAGDGKIVVEWDDGDENAPTGREDHPADPAA
jgi:hypothetical protein